MIFLVSSCAVSSAHDSVSAIDASPPTASASTALTLDNSHWRFAEVGGNAVPVGINATLIFDAKGHVSGHAGCNNYGGAYQQTADDGLHFGAMLLTKMACLRPARCRSSRVCSMQCAVQSVRAWMAGWCCWIRADRNWRHCKRSPRSRIRASNLVGPGTGRCHPTSVDLPRDPRENARSLWRDTQAANGGRL